MGKKKRHNPSPKQIQYFQMSRKDNTQVSYPRIKPSRGKTKIKPTAILGFPESKQQHTDSRFTPTRKQTLMKTQIQIGQKKEEKTLMREKRKKSEEHRMKTGIIINTLLKKRSTVEAEQEKGLRERGG